MTGLTVFWAWWTLKPMVLTAISPYTEITQGTITKLKLRKLQQTSQFDPAHCVELEYLYQVDRQKFIATRYQPADTGPVSGTVTLELLENYHLGDRIPVYYNPEDPTDAILKPPSFERCSSGIGLLVSLVLFTIFLWAGAIWLRWPYK
jgi:hypothetical protein